MGRYSTLPTLFDEIKSIDINFLNKNGYLHSSITGVITWSRNGRETGSIRVRSKINGNYKEIILLYNCDGNQISENLFLTSLPSNLGKGQVWYFCCNYTGKRCSKLHLIGGRFIHRSALRNGMYECQVQSKKWRWMEKTYGAYFDSERLYKELYKKHFKKFYNGRPTKRYLKLSRKLAISESFNVSEIEKLYLS